MIFDWQHLKERKTGYCAHLFLALGMALRLITTALALIAHGLIPFIKQPGYFKIYTLSDYLYDKHLKTHKKVVDFGEYRRK
jgi:hypothetical protein